MQNGFLTGSPWDVLTPTEVAEYCKVTPQNLNDARKKGEGPPCVQLGPRTVRYVRADVIAWLMYQRA